MCGRRGNACTRPASASCRSRKWWSFPVEDEPGAAAGVFQRIANAHINVRYTYLATGNRLVIAVADPQAVITALRH